MLLAAIATWLLTYAHTYADVPGGGARRRAGRRRPSRSASPTSRSWYPPEQQGTALGIFGAGNVGAAVTKFVAPVRHGRLRLGGGGAGLGGRAGGDGGRLLALRQGRPGARRSAGASGRSGRAHARAARAAEEPPGLALLALLFLRLRRLRGAGAVAAAATWSSVYGARHQTAGMVGAAFYSCRRACSAPTAGTLSDRYGARAVHVLDLRLLGGPALFMLSYPPTDYIIHGVDGPIAFSTAMGLVPFVVTLFVLGFFMSLGKAAVFKHIPVYYPNHVGAVGGLVGMIGGLGGFVLPIAFGVLLDLTGVWTSCFALPVPARRRSRSSGCTSSVRRMETRGPARRRSSALPELPEMQGIGEPGAHAPLRAGPIEDWRPEDPAFWAETGRRDRPAQPLDLDLLPAARLRGLDGLVGGGRAAAGDRLRLHHRPALLARRAAGAVGGDARGSSTPSWCRSSAGGSGRRSRPPRCSIPAFGIGYAVQNPETPYLIFLVLALLCGLGGGNFASSMANISFFFPKAEKGNALALNAGPRQPRRLGDAVPGAARHHRRRVRRARRRRRRRLTDGGRLWMQNAGFVWVPFIMAATVAAWFGMNDIAERQGLVRRPGGDLHAQAQLAHVLALHRDLRQLHRLFRGLPAARQDAVPGGELAAVRLPRAARRRAEPRRHRLGRRQVRRRARHLLGLHRHDRGGARGDLVPRHQGQPGAFWGFFAMLHGAVLLHRRRQFLDLPDDPGDHGPRGAAPDAGARARRAARGRSGMEFAAIIAFTSAIGAYGGFFIPKAYGSSIAIDRLAGRRALGVPRLLRRSASR